MKLSRSLILGLIFCSSLSQAAEGVSLALEAGRWHFDFAESPGSYIGPAQPYGDATGKAHDTGGSITLAIPLDDRLKLSLRLFKAEADANNAESSPNGCLGLKVINSNFSNGNCAGGPVSLTYKTEIDYSGFDVTLSHKVYNSDLQTLSVLSGLSYARLTQSHAFGSLPNLDVSMTDDLRSKFYGFGIGLEHVIRFTENLKLTGSLRADLLHSRNTMDVKQNLFFTPFRMSESDTKRIGRGQAKLGLAYDIGRVSLGLHAFAEYLSDVAHAHHSTLDGIYEPSRIDYHDGTVYGYGADLRFNF